MRVFKPRVRVALDVESIDDTEVKGIMSNLANLQTEVNSMNNGYASQVKAGIQEAQAMIDKMNKTNQEFDTLLTDIKNQLQQLTNIAIQYVQSSTSGIDKEPKFRDSFLYLTKDATANLQQLVDYLNSKVGESLKVVADSTPVSIDMKPNTSVDMTPENLLTSSINMAKDKLRKRIAALLPAVMKTTEKINISRKQNDATYS